MRAILFLLPYVIAYSSYSMHTDVYQFEDLMTEKSPIWLDLSQKDQEDLQFYKSIFEKNNKADTHAKMDQKIPKTLHFIWLGPNSFPENSKKNLLSWRELHPGWVMKFWTDHPERGTPIPNMALCSISNIPFSKVGQFIFKTQNYGEQSDLLRYEILFDEGGVYVDHDIECFHSIDSLSREYDFFGYLEAPTDLSSIAEIKIRLNNGLIGIRPGHPILKTVMNIIHDMWDEIEQTFPHLSSVDRTLKRTFISFTYGVRSAIDQLGNRDIVFPAAFGCPIYGFDTPHVLEVLREKKLSYARHFHKNAWHPLRIQKKHRTIKYLGKITIFVVCCLISFALGRKSNSSHRKKKHA